MFYNNKKKAVSPFDFFVSERKAERERQGLRYMFGIHGVTLTELQSDWRNLPYSERKKYEDQATKARIEAEEKKKKKMEAAKEFEAKRLEKLRKQKENEKITQELVEFYSKDTEALDGRNFVVMKITSMCKIRGGNGDRDLYIPGELCIACYSLELGMKKNYWTLIDPVKPPDSCGSEVADNNKVTGLPIPGSKMFQPRHRDYKKILCNVRRFVETYVEPHEENFGVFVMPDDIASVRGSIDWLLLKAFKDDPDSAERVECFTFFEKVRLAKYTTLFAKLIVVAKSRTPTRNKNEPITGNFQVLERWTEAILERGTYEFYQNLTCPYHNHEAAQDKMNRCCRNLVLRRIYLKLADLIQDMHITFNADTHEAKQFGKGVNQAPYVPGGGPTL